MVQNIFSTHNPGGSIVKKILEISFVYIGLVIGAGFASGREIFEYFNLSSRYDFAGIILAAVFFALIAYITMHQSARFGTSDFDGFIQRTAGRAALLVQLFMLLYMFCGFFVMMSGSGALISSTFSVHPRYGIFLLALICFVTFSFDITGIVVINAVMVPVMIVGMVLLCISASLYGGVPTFAALDSLSRNSLVSAACYVSYNTITVGAVLVPLAAKTERKTMLKAAVLGGSVLGILIFMVWSTLNIYYSEIIDSEMPLLDIAAVHGLGYEMTYTAVLFMALCTTAVSHGFGVLSKLKLKKRSDRILTSAALCLAAMPFARIGFSDLIAKLYSAFGYIGIVWMGMLIFTYIKQE